MKKKTRGKRLLSILLACIMMISLVPSTMFAVGSSDGNPKVESVTIGLGRDSNKHYTLTSSKPYFYAGGPDKKSYGAYAEQPFGAIDENDSYIYFDATNGVLHLYNIPSNDRIDNTDNYKAVVSSIWCGGNTPKDLTIKYHGECSVGSAIINEVIVNGTAHHFFIANLSGGNLTIEGANENSSLFVYLNREFLSMNMHKYGNAILIPGNEKNTETGNLKQKDVLCAVKPKQPM